MKQPLHQPIADLGFEIDQGPDQTNNHPDGFVTSEQLEKERKMNLEIIEDNGGEGK